ncbi:LysR family transcriptional regulator [Paraburkholderia sp. CNPSo 3272]|uniref:helix-turn-helix domain-containing protein n=1 Tax=Paraburkholderia sp. CNPSo 3272 TaxID=2940931 RepID=UPI0035CD29DE
MDITPPAATKRLAQLEARLGVRLVNRTGSPQTIHPAGKVAVVITAGRCLR